VTVFKGRFVCDFGGDQVPLAGARAWIVQAGEHHENLLYNASETFSRRLAERRHDSNGEVQFEVPFSRDDNHSYFVEVASTTGTPSSAGLTSSIPTALVSTWRSACVASKRYPAGMALVKR
jgi:hypothetical protein